MKEIDLNKLKDYYREKLQQRFKKENKLLEKLFQGAQKEIAETMNGLKTWTQRPQGTQPKRKGQENVEPLDEKTQKIMERFVEHIIEALNDVKIPFVHNEISYENANNYGEDIKKLYQSYNEYGRKSIKQFFEQYKLEIKELEMHLNNLGNVTQKIGGFLRNNYQDAKIAEAVYDKIPRFISMIEKIGQTKTQLELMDQEFAKIETTMKNYMDRLDSLNQDPALMEFESLDTKEQKKINDLQDQLKFKKALKKVKSILEKNITSYRGISDNDIRGYIKNPIEVMISQGPKLNNLKELLKKLRILVEDNSDPLQIKGDLKNKMLSNINQIVDENLLEPSILELIEIRNKKNILLKQLEAKGLSAQRIEIKDKIANLTVEIEHETNDLNRRKREYRELLERVAIDREDLQKAIKEQAGEEIKISVIIPQ